MANIRSVRFPWLGDGFPWLQAHIIGVPIAKNHYFRVGTSFPWSAAHNSDIERLTTSQALWASSG